MSTYTIGYSSLGESSLFVALRTRTLIEAAETHPADIDLLVTDNAFDDDRALANAKQFAEKDVDLAIIFHINERLGSQFHSILMPTPIIAVDVPIPFARYFGANNAYAGQLVGEAMADWVVTHWEGQADRVLILTDSRVLSVVRDRVDYALQSLRAKVPVDDASVLYLDGGSTTEVAYTRTAELLARWENRHRIVVLAANDDMAFGALQAAEEVGRRDDVVLGGQGADERFREHLKTPNPRIVASTDYRLDQYGPKLIDLAVRMLQKEHVPTKTYVDHFCVTAAST